MVDACSSASQKPPPGAATMLLSDFAPGMDQVVMWPAVVMRPTWVLVVNQSAPSDPRMMSLGRPLDWMGKFVMVPTDVMRPMPVRSVNHMA